jgi:hypothetical protein
VKGIQPSSVNSHVQRKLNDENKKDVNFENKKQGCRLSRFIRNKFKEKISNQDDPIIIDDQEVPCNQPKTYLKRPSQKIMFPTTLLKIFHHFLVGRINFLALVLH